MPTVALLGILSAVSIWYGRAHRPYSGTRTALTGIHLSSINCSDGSASIPLKIPDGRVNILFYFGTSSPQNLQIASYAAYLSRSHPESPVRFSIYTAGEYPDLRQLEQSGEVPFAVCNDASGAIGRRLRVQSGQDRALVIGKSGTVLFGPPQGVFSPEETRELWERYTQGHISYASGRIRAETLVGHLMPDIIVRAVGRAGAEGLPRRLYDVAAPGTHDFLIFSASCAACTLASALRTMLPVLRGGRTVAVITSLVPVPELVAALPELGRNLKIFQATSEIWGFESVYFARGPEESSVLLVHTSRKGVIETVRPLP